jgi:glucose/arabinose dehydrogenase
MAGPLDPAHRFERIGSGVEDTAAVLPMPGEMRALVLVRTGELRLVCGDGLIDTPLATVDVRSECPEKGLLSGVWAPDQAGRELYLTYVSGATGFFTVGKLTFDERLVPSDVEVIWQAVSPAPCDNLGGGIAFAADGTLLVGTGDFGNPAGAGQLTAPVGKILRFTAEGLPPQAPLEPNPFGASPTYAMGCRNPVRLSADSETGEVWFLDLGPGDNDEINLVDVQTNYGWNATMMMGRFELPGDPHHVWSPAVGPTGFNLYRGGNFKNAGRLMVSAADGLISEISVDVLTQANSSEQILFTPDLDGPQSFKDLAVLPDGMLYVVDDGGDLWRLVNAPATPSEPSSRSSIVPMLATRLPSGDIEIAGERSAGLTQFGVYVGDLMLLAQEGYNHGVDQDGDGVPEETLDFRLADLNEGDAWSRFQVGVDELAPDRAPVTEGADGRTGIYFLLSGDSSKLETGVGFDSAWNQRPGGVIPHTCRDCGGLPLGNDAGECSDPFSLDTYAIAGAGNVLGATEFPLDWDCDVIQLSISAEWCGPCRSLAAQAESVYQANKDRGFTIVDVLFENTAGQADDPGVVDRWAADFGLTHPVIHDDNRRVWNQWRVNGSIPQTWIIGCDGVVTDWILGANPGAIEAAIERELDLDKCN